jgi:hypothetical protein
VRGGAVTLARAEAALLRQPLTLLYQSSEEKRPVVLMTNVAYVLHDKTEDGLLG